MKTRGLNKTMMTQIVACTAHLAPVAVKAAPPGRARPGRHRDPETGLMVIHAKHYAIRITAPELEWLATQARLETQDSPRVKKATRKRRDSLHQPIRNIKVARLLLVVGLGQWRLPWWRLPPPARGGNKSEVVCVTIDDEEWDALVQRAETWRPWNPDPVRYCVECTLGRIADAGTSFKEGDKDLPPVLLARREEAILGQLFAAILLARDCHPQPAAMPALMAAWQGVKRRFEAVGQNAEDEIISQDFEKAMEVLQLELEHGMNPAEAAPRWENIIGLMQTIGGAA